ncbi:MAG: hypothetical protein ABFC67_10630 [Mizugakiibacter sp.]|uniref:hypothetical protein n=1 Tax=Mizugakiibacter sp. TaxID=1972610 RepID=UPI0031C7EBDA|nr:hypothetical protein [Xanthomonadaceae bacterium]
MVLSAFAFAALSVQAASTSAATGAVPEAVLSQSAPAAQRYQWDQHAVRVDLDADGATDFALLGRSATEVVAAYAKGPLTKFSRATILRFPVDAGRQDAVCDAAVALRAEDTTYEPGEEEIPVLPGFRRIAGPHGLVLEDGVCDSIHLYWDHASHRLRWWRR